jgi:hypothetical protein
VLELDATFNTNNLGLLLFVAVGITHTERSFPAAFAFGGVEDGATFRFFFECLKELIFINNIPLPRVLVSDQASGLMTVIDDSLLNTISQLCEWHGAENIRKKVASKRYTKEKREEIHSATWTYIKSASSEELERNRASLYLLLDNPEINYVIENWLSKEARIIRYHTEKYPNFGIHGTSRNEGMHPVVRDIINPQLSLATVVVRLSATVDRIYRDLLDSEHESRIQRPRGVDVRGFAIVLNKIFNTAVNRIAPEWECAKEMAGSITEKSEAFFASPCECTIIARFGLPCRHKLLRAAREGFSLPISLVHPR